MALLIIDSSILFVVIALGLGLVAIHIYQRRSRSILRQQDWHIWATASLHNAGVAGRIPLPQPGDWAMSSSSLAHIYALIMQQRPKLVVELGSGLSTAILAHALRKTGGHLISVDADPMYLNRTRVSLEGEGLEDQVTMICAPLEKFRDTGRSWYATSALMHIDKIDLLVIDGPPDTTCHMARYPALPFFFDRLMPGATIVLDDAVRADESRALKCWLREFPLQKVYTLPFPHHPAILARRETIGDHVHPEITTAVDGS